MARRWYQTLDIDGVVFEDPNRKHSKFWNEGKWDNFIAPLLPDERRTFIEIGCNAGLFLKMATDAGYKDVIGVEGNGQIMRQAERYRESVGGDWKLIPRRVGVNFDLDKLPVADVVLIANMHYYLPIGVFSKLVDDLRNRCLYCIVVSAKAKRRPGNALYDYRSVYCYFRDWDYVESIGHIDPEGDPCPRPDMYGVLFKGNLTAINVDEYFEAAKNPGHRSHGLAPAMRDFFERVLVDDPFKYEDTALYEYWRKREARRTPEKTNKRLDYKASLALDVQATGMKEPIYLNSNMKLLDGIHRLCIAKLLEYEHILARVL
jgi:hypothetical protein